ncbi:hypothetical protein PMAYCL1PPCAC_31749, partial [Pristionchus mayeri]
MVYENDCLLLRITYLSTGLLFNFLPCILLVIFSGALAHRIRTVFSPSRLTVCEITSISSAESARSSRIILLIVLITFITDLPGAIICVLVSFMADRFRSDVANKVESLIATLVMIARAWNLVIHVCVSRRFREVEKDYKMSLVVKLSDKQ